MIDFSAPCDTIYVMKKYDVIIIGAGAAGLAAAGSVKSRGRSVAILEMGAQPARKVRASGGGRCNITNMDANYTRYFGQNPNFVRGALSRVRPGDILDWGVAHGLTFVEKAAGQFFCATGSGDVVDALVRDAQGCDIFYNTPLTDIKKPSNQFIINNQFQASSVIIATGGVSFPSLGVSDIGHKVAKQFGHKIIPCRPALCAMATHAFPSDLSGVALDAEITIQGNTVHDAMLLTHFGIGGPAVYRASLYDVCDGITINMCPGVDLGDVLRGAKQTDGKKSVATILGQYIPTRIAKWAAGDATRNIADYKNDELNQIANRIQRMFIAGGDLKYHNMSSAEVVRGGVDTSSVSSKTMESTLCPGLFFAGEVLDIAGDLGGFNLHWAWASGIVAGNNA